MTKAAPPYPGGFLAYVIADESRTRRLLILLCPVMAVMIAVVVTLIVVILHAPAVASAVGAAFGMPTTAVALRGWLRRHSPRRRGALAPTAQAAGEPAPPASSAP